MAYYCSNLSWHKKKTKAIISVIAYAYAIDELLQISVYVIYNKLRIPLIVRDRCKV